MKVSIHIECDDLEELQKVTSHLKSFGNKKTLKVKPAREAIDPTVNLPSPRNRFIPLAQWENFHPWPTVSGLRHLRFYGATSGFNP